MSGRDFQRSKVYAWERAFVYDYDKTLVSFSIIESIVNYVWQEAGLSYPPKVELFDSRKTSASGDATRTKLRFQKSVPTWVVLHEIAHAMTATIDDPGSHGPEFVGTYMKLLEKHLNIPIFMSAGHALKHKVKFKL